MFDFDYLGFIVKFRVWVLLEGGQHVAAAIPFGAQSLGHHDGAAAVSSGPASGLASPRRCCRLCAPAAALTTSEAPPHTGGKDQGERSVLILIF